MENEVVVEGVDELRVVDGVGEVNVLGVNPTTGTEVSLAISSAALEVIMA